MLYHGFLLFGDASRGYRVEVGKNRITGAHGLIDWDWSRDAVLFV